MTKALGIVSLTVLLVAGASVAMAASLSECVVRVDLDAGTDTSVTENAASPWAVGSINKTRLVVEPQQSGQEIQNMTGFSCDIKFDAQVLELVDIYELRGDVNFDGFQDVGDLVTIFQSDAFDTFQEEDESYIRYYDINKDDFVDVGDLVAVFQSDKFDSAGEEFWTSNDGDYIRESVEIFDEPSVSNLGGAHPGFIDDVVSVLLLRPDTTGNGVADDGSGFDVAPFSGPRAVIANIEWRVREGASGTTQIAIVGDHDASLPDTQNPPVAIGTQTDLNNPESPAPSVSTVHIQ